jgi:A/G-specific adenine glycosylase
MLCPWSEACVARGEGDAESLPMRAAKPERPRKHGVVFWTWRGDGAILLRRRPENGLLGGLMEVPSTEWRAESWTIAEATATAPLEASWRPLDGVVRHGFTHFELELSLVVGQARGHANDDDVWCPVDRLSDYALPTLMKKVVHHALVKLAGDSAR